MSARRERVLAMVRDVLCGLIVAVALGALALWLLPAVLARRPSHGMTAAQRLAAVNAVRAPLAAFLIAIGAAGTL